jgi:peptide/nickel transport system ATP-binding protein
MNVAAEPDVQVDISDLKVHFLVDGALVRAVDGIDLQIARGRTLGIVGESGCGKSITARAIMGLVRSASTRTSGRIAFTRKSGERVDMLTLPADGSAMRAIRGGEIAMIFQEPMTSLNPVFTIGDQILEAITWHTDLRGKAAEKRALEMLDQVGIPDPQARMRSYPHQLSGGMRQRVMIAMALACNPLLLLADEPTTALDVTVQAQILDLLRRLQSERGMAVAFITHDLGVIAEIAHDAAVVYLGQVVERAPVEALFENPAHPYTQGLLHSMPRIGQTERLEPIPGLVPDPRNIPDGCRFAARCPHRMDICATAPPVFQVGPKHEARCWLHQDKQEVA